MSHETEIRALYQRLLDAWNQRDAKAFAGLFADGGAVVGFDGSQMNGPAEIASSLASIFADHPTGRYVGIVRRVRFLNSEAAVLEAVAGVAPAGQSDLNPALNSVQSLVAAQQGDRWRIALYHNTPAAWHGRPEAVQALTEELRRLL